MKNWDFCIGMYGSMDSELEVQRTIKRAELTALPLPSQKECLEQPRCLSTSKELKIGCERGEWKCINPKASDADLWIKILEELHRLAARDIVVEAEHVQGTQHKERYEGDVAFLRSLSLKATRKRMSGQRQEQCWTKDS